MNDKNGNVNCKMKFAERKRPNMSIIVGGTSVKILASNP